MTGTMYLAAELSFNYFLINKDNIMDKLIYMDNAATTSTAPEVVSAMLPFFTEYYGNPSSVYNFARKARWLLKMQGKL